MEKAFKELKDALVSYGHDEGFVYSFDNPKIISDGISPVEITASFRMLPNPEGLSAEQVFFNADAPALGLSKDAYGHQVELDGKTVEVFGVNPRARKYKLLVRDVATGDMFKVPLFPLD